MTGNGPFDAPSAGPDTDTGHGHVWLRPDRQVARCGGASRCGRCGDDAARWVKIITWADTKAPAPKLAAPPPASDWPQWAGTWPQWAGTEPQEVDPDIDDLTQDQLAEYAHTPELHAVAEALVHWFNHISGLRPGFARPHVGTFLEHLAAAGYRVVATDTPTEVERLQAELLAIAGNDPDLRTVYAYELGARDSDSETAAAARTYLATQGGSIVVDVYPHGGGRIWLDQGNRRRELLADTFRSIDPEHPDVITQYVAESLHRLAQGRPGAP